MFLAEKQRVNTESLQMRRDGILILILSVFAIMFWVVVELSKRLMDITQ